MRAPLALAGVLLAATTLTACGGSDSDSDASGSGSSSDSSSSSSPGESKAEQTASYCSDYKKLSSAVDSEEPPSLAKVKEVSGQFEDIADEAPANVAAQWQTLSSGFGSLADALTSSGITPKQYAAARSGKVPSGVTRAQLQEVQKAAQAVDDDRFDEAFKAIDADAKKTCK